MKTIMSVTLAAVAALATLCGCSVAQKSGVDRVLLNAAVYTVDDEHSWAEALAIDAGKIVYVGTNEGARKLIDAATQVDELDNKMVMPGFHDSHAHVLAGGLSESSCNLNDLRDRALIREALIVCSKEPRFAENDWVVGARWALAAFDNGQPPIEWLDEIFAGKPAYFVDSFSHSAWVSSSALAIAGIDADTPNPDGGVIERDPKTGKPTGTLRDTAMALVGKHTPPETDESRRDGILAGQRRAAAFGITAYTEPGLDEAQASAYQRADSAGELSARVLISLSPASWHTAAFGSEIFDLLAKRNGFSGRYVSADSVKIYIDGVIETRTSYMLQPYEGGEENFPPFYNQKTLNELVQKIDAMGVQVHTHAIGDGAIRNALNAYEHARKVNGPSDNRHQITHLQLIDKADIPRFGDLNVAADFQSLWAYPDDYIDVAIPEVGEERVSRFYPIASVVKTGGTIIGGSDWDVSSLNPLEAIEVAVTRQDPWSNKGPILTESERVELATIIDAYTRNAAFVMRLDDVSGSLEVGKSADLIVLDRNLFKIEPAEISEAKVLMTMVDGREVFSNDAPHPE
ncbi:MAG: amidohydrolase [Pseudomonadales bacterium]